MIRSKLYGFTGGRNKFYIKDQCNQCKLIYYIMCIFHYWFILCHLLKTDIFRIIGTITSSNSWITQIFENWLQQVLIYIFIFQNVQTGLHTNRQIAIYTNWQLKSWYTRKGLIWFRTNSEEDYRKYRRSWYNWLGDSKVMLLF